MLSTSPSVGPADAQGLFRRLQDSEAKRAALVSEVTHLRAVLSHTKGEVDATGSGTAKGQSVRSAVSRTALENAPRDELVSVIERLQRELALSEARRADVTKRLLIAESTTQPAGRTAERHTDEANTVSVVPVDEDDLDALVNNEEEEARAEAQVVMQQLLAAKAARKEAEDTVMRVQLEVSELRSACEHSRRREMQLGAIADAYQSTFAATASRTDFGPPTAEAAIVPSSLVKKLRDSRVAMLEARVAELSEQLAHLQATVEEQSAAIKSSNRHNGFMALRGDAGPSTVDKGLAMLTVNRDLEEVIPQADDLPPPPPPEESP